MKNETGQIILVLILVMTVALAIGISVIQRSISDISTASKTEQSSRAFSAAEAGIEDLLSGGTGIVNFAENSSTAQATGGNLMPAIQSGLNPQAPLEYPSLSKEEVAHVWLANLDSLTNPPAEAYKRNSLDVYWGNSDTDKAALELTLVYYASNKYQSQKYFYDQISRTPANNFTPVSCTGENTLVSGVIYQCKQTITFPTSTGLMLLRARLLYNTSSQPFAVQAVGTSCGSNCSLPPQARSIISTGTAGTTQRRVRLFQINKVVPSYFDYAIFSTGDINK